MGKRLKLTTSELWTNICTVKNGNRENIIQLKYDQLHIPEVSGEKKCLKNRVTSSERVSRSDDKGFSEKSGE